MMNIKIRKFYVLIVSIILIVFMLFALPVYEKNILLKYQENQVTQIVEISLESISQYESTGESHYLDKLRTDLLILSYLHRQLYNLSELDKEFSMDILAVCTVLEKENESIKDMKYLKGGLECLYSDVYSEVGFMFNLFYNANTH